MVHECCKAPSHRLNRAWAPTKVNVLQPAVKLFQPAPLLNRIELFHELSHASTQGYRVHIHMEKSWGQDKLPSPTLSYWCFIPGMAFRMLSALNLRR